MAAGKVSEADFIRIWQECHSPTQVAARIGCTIVNVQQRRRRLEGKGVFLQTIAQNPGSAAQAYKYGYAVKPHAYEPLVKLNIVDGYVVIFGDAHFWPGERSLAHEALCIAISKILRPVKLIIGNGDLFDGANISRHDVLGWQRLPTVADELEACRIRLDEIKRACPKAQLRATVGNHDSRMDRRLATEIPQFQDVHGMSLQDHLKDWPLSYAILLNEDTDPIYVVHNVKGGIHATWNNTAATGCHVVTGHLHDQNERTRSFLLKESVGVDHGCLADVDAPSFSYRMTRPANWRSGFAVLKVDKQGRLFPPELCRVQIFKNYRRAIFRGEMVCERKA